ncbi:Transcription elongation factor SPT5 [Desmophyllum pertusum]|uniref:Transcription elongation factor SPT5 n=1 Tax=Desmophyllum pertusum TaxID=174260 RepID=A0A9W9ZEQ5_9CNID|nr:Transcription elongation factor SPT5 [Desmophyllum pertusum]
MEEAQADWVTTDIEVRINENHEDPQLMDKKGVVRTVSGNTCTVYLYDEKRDVSVSINNVDPGEPVKLDKVKVIIGDDRERVGTLINIDDPDGIIKMDQTDQLKILPSNTSPNLVPQTFELPLNDNDVLTLCALPREDDLREAFPHSWVSSNDNF